MTVVYLDLLILVNLVANILLLHITAKMSGLPRRKVPILISASLGALYAALPFLGAEFLSHPLCKIGCGILMALIAFGKDGRLFRTTLLFFGASAALGGMVWAAELLGGSKLTLMNGVLYSWVDIRLLLLLLILCYTILSAVSGRLFRHGRRELVEVSARIGERKVELTALVDTGHTLTDPATNRPVLVAEGRACRRLIPFEVPLERPVEALEALGAAGVKGVRLLPYRAVGVSGGLLLALRTDEMTLGGHTEKGILVALSPTPVSDGGAYQALIGGTTWTV